MTSKKFEVNVAATKAVVERPAPASTPDGFLSGKTVPSFDLNKIVRDERAQPRVKLNEEVVKAYEAMMREEGGWGPFPEVIVFGPTDEGIYYLADGFHRLEAATRAKVELVRASIKPGGLRQAILHSVGANATHGLRRTNADKRKAVETLLLDPEWARMSDTWIAKQAAVSQPTVSKVRQELVSTHKVLESTERVGQDGRVLQTANIGKTKAEDEAVVTPDSKPLFALRKPTTLAKLAEQARRAKKETVLTAAEVRQGTAALLLWTVGQEAPEAADFLRKLGVKPPKEM